MWPVIVARLDTYLRLTPTYLSFGTRPDHNASIYNEEHTNDHANHAITHPEKPCPPCFDGIRQVLLQQGITATLERANTCLEIIQNTDGSRNKDSKIGTAMDLTIPALEIQPQSQDVPVHVT